MAFTFGFYDSYNGDRTYSAMDFGRMFDGVITDGVFASVDDGLQVVASGSGRTVNVKKGRAWVNHTWCRNDALYPLTLDAIQTPGRQRIDAIIIETNETPSAATGSRTNSLKVVKGTEAASNPAKPTLRSDTNINQYALAWVFVSGSTIRDADIEDARGRAGGIAFVSGSPVITLNTADLFAQWADSFLSWKQATSSEFDSWKASQKSSFESWYNTLRNYLTQQQYQQLSLAISDLNYLKEAPKQVMLSANGWSNSAPYTQTKSVSSIRGTDSPLWWFYVPSGTTTEIAANMSDEASKINTCVTSSGQVTFTCYRDKPTVDVYMRIKET